MGAWRLEDWNAIIRKVNTLAENPDDGCDPLGTIPEVEDPHLWSVQDIEEVRNRLMEICGDNDFSTQTVKWKQDIVDEIEAAIEAGWCDCEICLDDCENADGYVVTHKGTMNVNGYHYDGPCPGPPSMCTIGCINAVSEIGEIASEKLSEWIDARKAYCVAEAKVKKLEKRLERLEAQLAVLEASRDEICASGSAKSCADAQQLVDDKQVEVDDTQSELDNATEDRDTKKSESEDLFGELDGLAEASMAQAVACPTEGQGLTYASLVDEAPWGTYDCDKVCGDGDPTRCAVAGWRISSRVTGTTDWVQNLLTGGYMPSGKPFATSMRYCSGPSTYYCTSCGPTDPGEEMCYGPAGGGPYVIEFQLTQIYPDPQDPSNLPECCGTGTVPGGGGGGD